MGSVDWTQVLIAAILTIPAIISALYAGRIHQQIKTPSGQHIGAMAEYTKDTVIANNVHLKMKNGPSRKATREQLDAAVAEGPQVPEYDPPVTHYRERPKD